jgi:hypothetical protein
MTRHRSLVISTRIHYITNIYTNYQGRSKNNNERFYLELEIPIPEKIPEAIEQVYTDRWQENVHLSP